RAGAEARERSDAASLTALLTIAAVAVALVGSLVIAVLVSRQIVRPLLRLTETAKEVRDDLPLVVARAAGTDQDEIRIAEVPVESQDEVGQLAEVFNEVNATTIKIAQEQAALRAQIAEMFVNVARRDQALLNRQLSFLDDLERTEE